jgi:orotidine-5'-phosphate decarboxylase
MVRSTSSDTAVPFYEYMAQTIASWKTEGDLGLVVGATYPSELKRIREVCPSLPILVPGVGSQGGTLVDSVVNGIDSRGAGILISVSRQVLYASSDSDNYAIAATGAAEILRSSINEALRSEGSTWMK